MAIKSLEEIFKELEDKGYEPLPPNSITGEEWEKWLREEYNKQFKENE